MRRARPLVIWCCWQGRGRKEEWGHQAEDGWQLFEDPTGANRIERYSGTVENRGRVVTS